MVGLEVYTVDWSAFLVVHKRLTLTFHRAIALIRIYVYRKIIW